MSRHSARTVALREARLDPRAGETVISCDVDFALCGCPSNHVYFGVEALSVARSGKGPPNKQTARRCLMCGAAWDTGDEPTPAEIWARKRRR